MIMTLIGRSEDSCVDSDLVKTFIDRKENVFWIFYISRFNHQIRKDSTFVI